ncbi:hypothetical protein V6N13_033179 [Hibiscus sabdariffa]|uniref:Uncharacterized protein n=1 Tax=Hibiscus sabdariffa TaxID=183260 RepID=A0ABR2FB94_9ROSI
MAEPIDDAEFWLPFTILMDDDILMENQNLKSKNGGQNNTESLASSHCFPTEFPYEFDYSYDSFSVVESTETESSDEEADFLAGLTRRIVHSTSQKRLAVTKSRLTIFTLGLLESWKARNQQQHMKNKRPSFQVHSLDGFSGNERISAGTGVFFPRECDNKFSQPRKKSGKNCCLNRSLDLKTGCPMFLLPVKVVLALNFNFDHANSCVASDYGE